MHDSSAINNAHTSTHTLLSSSPLPLTCSLTTLPLQTTTTTSPSHPNASDSWDKALDAFRARQKRKAQGAERLRNAGFDDDFMENSCTAADGVSRDERDIKWAEKGAVREWDRGKVVEESGRVILKAPW